MIHVCDAHLNAGMTVHRCYLKPHHGQHECACGRRWESRPTEVRQS